MSTKTNKYAYIHNAIYGWNFKRRIYKNDNGVDCVKINGWESTVAELAATAGTSLYIDVE